MDQLGERTSVGPRKPAGRTSLGIRLVWKKGKRRKKKKSDPCAPRQNLVHDFLGIRSNSLCVPIFAVKFHHSWIFFLRFWKALGFDIYKHFHSCIEERFQTCNKVYEIRGIFYCNSGIIWRKKNSFSVEKNWYKIRNFQITIIPISMQ